MPLGKLWLRKICRFDPRLLFYLLLLINQSMCTHSKFLHTGDCLFFYTPHPYILKIQKVQCLIFNEKHANGSVCVTIQVGVWSARRPLLRLKRDAVSSETWQLYRNCKPASLPWITYITTLIVHVPWPGSGYRWMMVTCLVSPTASFKQT